MGYVGGELSELTDETPIRRFGARMTRKAGSHLRDRVARHTPVAKAFEHETAAAFVSRRGGRAPGTLKRSWRVGEVEVLYDGTVFRVDVYTNDPVAPYVEWDTRPHIIVPKDPEGMLVFETAQGTVFAKLVHHPGTTGAHMMATAIAEVAETWRALAKRELRETTRNWFQGGGSA